MANDKSIIKVFRINENVAVEKKNNVGNYNNMKQESSSNVRRRQAVLPN